MVDTRLFNIIIRRGYCHNVKSVLDRSNGLVFGSRHVGHRPMRHGMGNGRRRSMSLYGIAVALQRLPVASLEQGRSSKPNCQD
jgi:hypothetical protein